MNSRNHKSDGKLMIYKAGIETLIERLKKVRALNCSPSDVGIDNEAVNKLSFGKFDISTRPL